MSDATPSRAGRIEWIGIGPGRGAPIEPRDRVTLVERHGIEGDRHAGRGKRRHVTIVQWEHLPVIAAVLGREAVEPGELRRNIAVSGINVHALQKRRFRLGDALLEGTGYCDPCELMDTSIGPGGLDAMAGHGGITAKVLEGGEVTLGAPLRPVD